MPREAGGRGGAGRERVLTPEDLQIAGLVPLSTVDWPGRFAASLFFQGCPWLCPYCQNSAIIDPRIPGVVSWSALEDLLARRRGLLDGVVFSGGEATRQIALAAGMRRVRELGFGVGLHTAGPYPGRVAALLDEGLVDWVGIDVKATPDEYEAVAGRPGAGARAWESLAAVLSHPEVDHEVRLTVYPDGPADGLEVARRVREGGARAFALQQARDIGTPDGFRSRANGWDDQVRALAADIEALGFDRFEFRPAD
ncbi:anaerobic ribonucleoside-triphosphate reductase activating protein [Actinomyces sp. B33]|uniref:anaerobic ribonucleoside-triphosphate reductase activating protein n=1 Tax=Actinomyces sp. B33 TaxID=2942131 RepID=UPI0023417787|nr:anaerobic ribonucleoside-triphosphate reductase activating protein [Actinomyces sp. B33]MDC4233411.1 anaerobic ribonucleoside-triphosphate reductase activating protein [Actinomyces sp. B33]